MTENIKRLYMMKAHEAMDLANKAEIAAAYALRSDFNPIVIKEAYEMCVDAAVALAETNAPTRSESLLKKAKLLESRKKTVAAS